MRLLMLAAAAMAAVLTPAAAEDAALGYAPMVPFERLAGRTIRGEGAGPNGETIADIATYEFILGGRAIESEHRVEGTSYGGKTVIFYDETAQQYIFHYFTTAGFHTTGTINLTDDGFEATEAVHGHEKFAAVKSVVTFDGEDVVLTSHHITHEGEISEGESRVYKPAPDAVVAYDTE